MNSLAELTQISDELRTRATNTTALRRERNDMIRAMGANGSRVIDLARATGLHRTVIHRIIEGGQS